MHGPELEQQAERNAHRRQPEAPWIDLPFASEARVAQVRGGVVEDVREREPEDDARGKGFSCRGGVRSIVSLVEKLNWGVTSCPRSY